jgi:hypothetical protein
VETDDYFEAAGGSCTSKTTKTAPQKDRVGPFLTKRSNGLRASPHFSYIDILFLDNRRQDLPRTTNTAGVSNVMMMLVMID